MREFFVVDDDSRKAGTIRKATVAAMQNLPYQPFARQGIGDMP